MEHHLRPCEDVVVHHGVLDARLDFIGKPYSLSALTSKVREILDGPKQGTAS
jgi:hypothetical protein